MNGRGWICATVALLVTIALAHAAPSDDPGLLKRLRAAGCLRSAGAAPTAAAIETAKKQCPDQTPTLRIETSAHTSAIKSIAVDAACTVAVTGSDDKTIRLWSLPDGRPLRVIRPPIGPGDGGRVYAVALSPDGRWIAAGGRDARGDAGSSFSVEIYARKGVEARRIGSFSRAVISLAFSPDGRRLAVGLDGNAGVAVLDFGTGEELNHLKGYGGAVTALVWDRDGSLYAASYDGYMRPYGPDLAPRGPYPLKSSGPMRLAIAPDQHLLAIGLGDRPRVELLELPDLRPEGSADVSGLNGDVSSLAWVDDDRLVGGHRATDASSKYVIRLWDRRGKKVGVDRPVSSDFIFGLEACRAGAAFAAFDPKFGLVDRAGAIRMTVMSATMQMDGAWRDALSLSPDAKQISLALDKDGKDLRIFDLQTASLRLAPTLPPGFLRAQTAGMSIDRWSSFNLPRLNGHAVALDKTEFSDSLAIGHRADRFFLGTNYHLLAFDARGVAVAPPKALGGIVWAVDLAADDRIVVAATDGGTIHWFRARDLTELLTLFVDVRNQRWVAWTPTGYYMASAGGEDLIGWHINRGWSQEAEFYPASQFHERFYRPDIVQRVLDTLDEKVAIDQADAERAKAAARSGERTPREGSPENRAAATAIIASNLPPQAFITDPKDGELFAGDKVTVSYRLSSATGASPDSVIVEADGQFVAKQPVKDRAEGTVVIDAPTRDFVVSLTPAAGGTLGAPASLKFVYDGKAPLRSKPNLYIIAIGVDSYENDREFPRTFAGEDVKALTDVFNKQAGRLFGRVEVMPLLDEHANILEWRKAFAALNLADQDYLLVYLVGHGWVDANNDFWFLTRSASMGNPIGTMLSEHDLLDPLKQVGGRKIVMFETCHAGAANKDRKGSDLDVNDVLNRFMHKSTVTFFGAAQGYQLAHIEPRWNNRGDFTQAIVEGLDGAAKTKDGTITVNSLSEYVIDRVGALTDQDQQPVFQQTIPNDFVLAIAPN